jgi:hypothetical protein
MDQLLVLVPRPFEIAPAMAIFLARRTLPLAWNCAFADAKVAEEKINARRQPFG